MPRLDMGRAMTVSDRKSFSTDATRLSSPQTANFVLPSSFDGGTLVAFKQGGGTGKGGLVPTEVLAPPKTGPVEGYNNIVQFRGAKTPVAPPPGVTAAPGQTFFQQGAFVFAAPTGDDTIAGRKYLGFAPGFSALSLLRASMQAQGFPSGSKVIWGEGLPREHQITADQARRFLATEGSAEDSRGGRALQRAEQAPSGKLLGIMNELAQRQKPATPALATRKPALPQPKPAPVAANPLGENKSVPVSQQPEAPLPPHVRPKASPLPPPPKFDEPLVANPFPKSPSPEEIAAKDAGLQRKAADAANTPVKSWGDAQKELNGLNQRLSALGASPKANRANGLLGDLTRLIVRGERLEQGLKASRAGEREDVVVGSTVLSPKEAARSLQQIRDEVANKMTALRKEIDGVTKSGATRQSSATTSNAFDVPEREGPIVLPGRPRASGEEPGIDPYSGNGRVSLRQSNAQGNSEQRVSAIESDPDIGGTVPPTKPPTGGGGNNGGVPDPDDNPEEWQNFIDDFIKKINVILEKQGTKISKSGLENLKEVLTTKRRISEYSKTDFMSEALKSGEAIASRNFLGRVDGNRLLTNTTLVLAGSGGLLAVSSNAFPDQFADFIGAIGGPHIKNPPEGIQKITRENIDDIRDGGSITSLQNQSIYNIGLPPEPKGNLADAKTYTENVQDLEEWVLKKLKDIASTVLQNTESQKILSTVKDSVAVVDALSRRIRNRAVSDGGTPDSNLSQVSITTALQGFTTLGGGAVQSAYANAMTKLRDGRALAIGNLVNGINADVAQARSAVRPSTGGFTFIPSADPSADAARIDINIREAQRYQNELAIGQAQVQSALDKLKPYLTGLETGGADLEGATALKQSQVELQTLLATIQGQQKSMGDTLLSLAQNRQSLEISLKNLSLSQQNTGLNEDNAVRNQIGRDEAAAANQRTLGKSALERWNAPAAPEAQRIEGAPGFRKPFSGRGNLLEKLDDAVRPFGLSANDVPTSVWLRVLDRTEPNWIYAVMEPTSKPLTQEEVTKRKAEILNQAGPADKALLDAVLGTMRNR
jgi:hypothetical protein